MKIKGNLNKILVIILAVILGLPFTISSYADPYLGTQMVWDPETQTTVLKDNNPVGQTYSSGSKIQYNVFNNNPDLSDNTFNGSTEINTGFDSLESSGNKFTGSTTLNVAGSGSIESNGDEFNTLTANTAGSNLNFNSSTFKGNVTINDPSNVTIGSTEESAQIVTNTGNTVTQLQNTNTILGRILNPIAILYHNITFSYISSSSSTVSFNLGGQSYSYTLEALPIDSSHTYYVNFRGMLEYYINTIRFHLSVWYNRSATAEDENYFLTSWNSFPIIVYKVGFYTYSYNASDDTINRSIEYRYSAFYTTLYNYIQRTLVSYIQAHIAYIADTFYRYYNPRIVPESNYFWYAYNSETGQYDQTNLAGLMQYITWYLGMIYNDSTNVTQTMHQMTNDINTAATTFQDLNTKEQAAIDQIKTGFNNFLPDNNIFQSFRAITWCSNYLQQIYLSLGSYGTVVLIGLLFGVCLQFIGYFRYK